MQRIMKLTPAVIKRIISEEKEKLKKEQELKVLEERKEFLKKLKLLKKIKDRQINSLKEAKELHKMKKKLEASIKKGDK